MSPDKKIPTHFQKATCWAALTGICLLTIVLLVGGIMYGLSQAFMALQPVLLPFIIAGILAYLLHPCVVWVQKRVKKRLTAVIAVLFTALLGLGALGATVVPPLIEQTGELITQRERILGEVVASGQNFLETNTSAHYVIDSLYERTLSDIEESDKHRANEVQRSLEVASSYSAKLSAVLSYYSGYLTEAGIRWLTAGTKVIYNAAGIVIGLVMIPVFLFYFLLHSESIQRNWHTVLPLRSSDFRQELVETLQQINGYIVSFVRGQMLVSLIDGLLLGIALKIMGLPYAITIAAAAALLGIIPYIGMVSTSIPALIISWFVWHDMSHLLAVAAIFIGVSQFDGWILQPKILGNRVGMHDLTIMFSVLFWSSVLGGIIGALLAVPLTASVKVIFIRYVWPSLSHDKGDAPPQQSISS